ETIRQDLERVVSRNIDIERIGRVIDSVRRDYQLQGPDSGQDPSQWLGGTKHGQAYFMYERLKLSTVADEFADILATALGIDPRSASGAALRVLGGTWRDLEHPDTPARRQFLLDFDIRYRLRRIRHVWRQIQAEYAKPRVPPDLPTAD